MGMRDLLLRYRLALIIAAVIVLQLLTWRAVVGVRTAVEDRIYCGRDQALPCYVVVITRPY